VSEFKEAFSLFVSARPLVAHAARLPGSPQPCAMTNTQLTRSCCRTRMAMVSTPFSQLASTHTALDAAPHLQPTQSAKGLE
jgi:hypothetical protein